MHSFAWHMPIDLRFGSGVSQRIASDLAGRSCVVSALGPNGNLEGLLHHVRWPDAKEPMLVVGHQPTLGFVAAYLLAGVAQTWTVRRGRCGGCAAVSAMAKCRWCCTRSCRARVCDRPALGGSKCLRQARIRR